MKSKKIQRFFWILLVIGFLMVLVAIGARTYKIKKIDPLKELTYEDYLWYEKVGGNLEIELGEEFSLRRNEIAHYPSVSNPELTLRITGFVNSGCPEGMQCIWSGLAVNFELTVGNEVYADPGNIHDAPYRVFVKGSDYETYARFVISRK